MLQICNSSILHVTSVPTFYFSRRFGPTAFLTGSKFDFTIAASHARRARATAAAICLIILERSSQKITRVQQQQQQQQQLKQQAAEGGKEETGGAVASEWQQSSQRWSSFSDRAARAQHFPKCSPATNSHGKKQQRSTETEKLLFCSTNIRMYSGFGSKCLRAFLIPVSWKRGTRDPAGT